MYWLWLSLSRLLWFSLTCLLFLSWLRVKRLRSKSALRFRFVLCLIKSLRVRVISLRRLR